MASSAVAEDQFWGVLRNGAHCKFEWVHDIIGGKVSTNANGTWGYARVLFNHCEHTHPPLGHLCRIHKCASSPCKVVDFTKCRYGVHSAPDHAAAVEESVQSDLEAKLVKNIRAPQ